MTKKTEAFIGLDYDAGSIRGVRLTRLAPGGEPRFSLEAVHEIGGDFAKDDGLTAALAIMKEKLRIGPGDRVASCISGKQVYVAQMPFRKLKQEETRKALRLELRKTLPFDATTAAIEFQVLEAAAEKPDEQQLLVTAVASTIIAKHLEIMDKAGIKPAIVDTLPTCVATPLLMGRKNRPMKRQHEWSCISDHPSVRWSYAEGKRPFSIETYTLPQMSCSAGTAGLLRLTRNGGEGSIPSPMKSCGRLRIIKKTTGAAALKVCICLARIRTTRT
jgi:hypothetical protein